MRRWPDVISRRRFFWLFLTAWSNSGGIFVSTNIPSMTRCSLQPEMIKNPVIERYPHPASSPALHPHSVPLQTEERESGEGSKIANYLASLFLLRLAATVSFASVIVNSPPHPRPLSASPRPSPFWRGGDLERGVKEQITSLRYFRSALRRLWVSLRWLLIPRLTPGPSPNWRGGDRNKVWAVQNRSV